MTTNKNLPARCYLLILFTRGKEKWFKYLFRATEFYERGTIYRHHTQHSKKQLSGGLSSPDNWSLLSYRVMRVWIQFITCPAVSFVGWFVRLWFIRKVVIPVSRLMYFGCLWKYLGMEGAVDTSWTARGHALVFYRWPKTHWYKNNRTRRCSHCGVYHDTRDAIIPP